MYTHDVSEVGCPFTSYKLIL